MFTTLLSKGKTGVIDFVTGFKEGFVISYHYHRGTNVISHKGEK